MLYKLTKTFTFISNDITYYYNPITNKTQWTPLNIDYAINLPENWLVINSTSNNDKIFFYNKITNISQYNIPINIDTTNFVSISKGEHGDKKTDGKILCKSELCPRLGCKEKGHKTFKTMYILNNLHIGPRPFTLNITNEIEICMEHTGIDFTERFPIEYKDDVENSINELVTTLSKTNLIFVDLCVFFNPENITYNIKNKKTTLIDIDLNNIRLGLDIDDNYWKDILEVYKDYVFRGKDEDYDDDPNDIFDEKLKQVNNKYLKYITLSQGLSSINITENDINKELFIKNSKNTNLFQDKLKTTLFQGLVKVKGYYDTKTPEFARLS